MKIDGVSAIAVILIASFGIDRIVMGLLFILSFMKPWDRVLPDPLTVQDTVERAKAEKKQKLLYFVCAGVLGGLVLAFFGEVRIVRALGFDKINYVLDSIMTGLILMAGADRVAETLKMMPGATSIEKSGSRPIEITGRLILEDETSKKVARE